MSAKRPLVIVTRKLPESVEARMRELFDVRLNPDDAPFPRERLVKAVKTAEVLVPTVTDKIDAAILAASGPKLKLVANFGAGLDHIDLDAAFARGLTVTNTPNVLTEDTADLAMALVLAVPRRMMEGARIIAKGKFPGWSPTWMMGRRVSGKALGVIGMGRIGQALAVRARAFGMAIHYHNRSRVPGTAERALKATYWEDLDGMLAAVDIVSVNCPATPATRHLLSAARLKLMKQGAYLINTARGEIVDEAALADLLEDGHLGGAGLDVFEHEPAVTPKLLTLPNVVLVPHLGSGTVESRTAMGEKVIVNITSYIGHGSAPDRVLPAMA